MKNPSIPERLPARERLLAAAESLFYEEGFNSVGIDRVIERAGVAKASLYDCFGSKDELIRAYLAARRDARQLRITSNIAKHRAPRARLLSVFDSLAESAADPGYRGCAFVKATAEARPDSAVRGVCDDQRRWTRELFAALAKEAGARHPAVLAKQLVVLYDGASISAQMDRDPAAATLARAMAAALLDADTRPVSPRSPRPSA